MADDKTIHLRDKTVRLSGGVPRVSGGDKMGRPGTTSLGGGRSNGYQLNDFFYHSLRVISEGTGEAQIYQVEHQGRPYVLKLYYPEAHPNRQILNVLKRVGRSGVLVELIDYGVFTDETGVERDYELMEYAGGGSLADFNMGKDVDRLRKIAMQAAISLDFCHQNGIIHRDVKPANFLFADESQERMVLSDFGIAMFCVDPTHPNPSEQTRTPLYAAPELYQNVIDGIVEIDRKVDFYSLGLVLLSLWLGDDFIRGDERAFMKKKLKNDLPYPDDLPAEFITLLRGLTIADPAKRWGFDEIKNWYRGENVPLELNPNKEMNIVFSSTQRLLARSAQELARLMWEHSALGIKYLYSGRITEWLKEYDMPEVAIEVDRIVEVHCPKNQQEGLRAACHTIDPDMPYLIACESEDQKVYEVECVEPDDVIRAYRDHKFTPEAQKALSGYGFLVWFSTLDEPVVYEELKQLIGKGKGDMLFDVLYTINKRVSFNFYFPDEATRPDYCFSAKQIAEYVTGRMASAYYRQKFADTVTGEGMEQPEDTLKRLYAYFGSKGWTDATQWVQSCFVFDSPENQEKCSPYNIAIATYRGIKGLGYSPYYEFSGCKKRVFSPDELGSIPREEIKTEMERGRLKEWLTIFYHEDPYITFSEKYDYEKQVRAYLLKLKELNPEESCVVKYTAAKALARKGRVSIEKKKTIFQSVRVLLSLLTFLPLLMLLALCVLRKYPSWDGLLPLFPWPMFVAVLVGSGCWQFLLRKFDAAELFRWQELRNVLFFYYLSLGVFYFIPAQYGWIYMLACTVTLIIHVIRKPVISVKTPNLSTEKDFEVEELEPLYQAFKDEQVRSAQETRQALDAKKATAFTKATRRFVRIIVPSMVVAWALLSAYIYYHPNMSVIGGKKIAGYGQVVSLQDSYWKGLIDKDYIILTIDKVNAYSGQISGTLSWKELEDISSHPLEGTVNPEEGTLTFELTGKETGKYLGAYTCTLNETGDELNGTLLIGKKELTFFVKRETVLTRLKDWWKTIENSEE